MHPQTVRIVCDHDHLMTLPNQLSRKTVRKTLDATHAGEAQGGKK
ncbi:MAG: hypothetical protein UC928_06215 [Collinsella sp.]|nr:hypothetical protein [Collinsella sp.]